jgi:predicted DNA-binding protein with PD1-like motif
MKSTGSEVQRVIFARFFEGEELLESIAEVARQNSVDSGFFFVIGTLRSAVLGYYKEGRYLPTKMRGTLEIASCMGNVSIKEDGEILVHGHIVVSDESGAASGGHVMQGCLVDATAELVLVKAESGTLRRALDKTTNLHLLNLSSESG